MGRPEEYEDWNPFPELQEEMEPWDFQQRYEEYLDRKEKREKEEKDASISRTSKKPSV